MNRGLISAVFAVPMKVSMRQVVNDEAVALASSTYRTLCHEWGCSEKLQQHAVSFHRGCYHYWCSSNHCCLTASSNAKWEEMKKMCKSYLSLGWYDSGRFNSLLHHCPLVSCARSTDVPVVLRLSLKVGTTRIYSLQKYSAFRATGWAKHAKTTSSIGCLRRSEYLEQGKKAERSIAGSSATHVDVLILILLRYPRA